MWCNHEVYGKLPTLAGLSEAEFRHYLLAASEEQLIEYLEEYLDLFARVLKLYEQYIAGENVYELAYEIEYLFLDRMSRLEKAFERFGESADPARLAEVMERKDRMRQQRLQIWIQLRARDC